MTQKNTAPGANRKAAHQSICAINHIIDLAYTAIAWLSVVIILMGAAI